jgi:hypothetical protein
VGVYCIRYTYMGRAALDRERIALLAEGEALVKAHERLHLAATDRPEQRAYRTRLKLHRERLRAYIRALRQEADDT